MKEITHPTLGRLMPVQGPIATSIGEEDDWDLALYVDGPAWMAKLELDYYSNITFAQETIEKEFLLDKAWMDQYGRGFFIAKFEELYDKVSAAQLSFIPIVKRIEIRNGIMDLMNEAFERLDKELAEDRAKGLA
jgi:hypothetical protein